MRRLRSGLRARLTPGRLLLAALLVGGAAGARRRCWRATSRGAPQDHAAALVPARPLAYVHANVEPRFEPVGQRAQSLLERLPALASFATAC